MKTTTSGDLTIIMSESNSIRQRLKNVVEQHGSNSDDSVEQKSDWREDAKGRDFAGSHTIDLSHLDDGGTSTATSDEDVTMSAGELTNQLQGVARRQGSIRKTGNPVVESKAASAQQAPTPGAVPDSEGESTDGGESTANQDDLLAGAVKSLETIGGVMQELDACLVALQDSGMSDDEIKAQVRERTDLGGSQ